MPGVGCVPAGWGPPGWGTAGWAPAAGAALRPKPKSAASERNVRALRLKLAFNAVRNGSKRALSVPTGPFHRLWVIDNVKPGSRSDKNVFDKLDVAQPVRPGCFAC